MPSVDPLKTGLLLPERLPTIAEDTVFPADQDFAPPPAGRRARAATLPSAVGFDRISFFTRTIAAAPDAESARRAAHALVLQQGATDADVISAFCTLAARTDLPMQARVEALVFAGARSDDPAQCQPVMDGLCIIGRNDVQRYRTDYMQNEQYTPREMACIEAYLKQNFFEHRQHDPAVDTSQGGDSFDAAEPDRGSPHNTAA